MRLKRRAFLHQDFTECAETTRGRKWRTRLEQGSWEALQPWNPPAVRRGAKWIVVRLVWRTRKEYRTSQCFLLRGGGSATKTCFMSFPTKVVFEEASLGFCLEVRHLIIRSIINKRSIRPCSFQASKMEARQFKSEKYVSRQANWRNSVFVTGTFTTKTLSTAMGPQFYILLGAVASA